MKLGFSLLELVLAIGLSIALVTLLGAAINLHLVRLDSSATTIQQAQLARAVLDRIADDLRAATMAPTQDVSELLSAAEQAAQFNVDEVDSEAEDVEGAVEQDPPPGINGLPDTVQIDRRRLRQSLSLLAESTTPVAWADAGWSQVTYGMSVNAAAPGLVRAEVDRDHAQWRLEQGQAAPAADPIAGEVLAVRFAYFDGNDFLKQWDMSEQQALPLAVEVTIEVIPADESDAATSVARRTARTYRRFVRIAAAAHESSTSGSATAADQSDGGF